MRKSRRHRLEEHRSGELPPERLLTQPVADVLAEKTKVSSQYGMANPMAYWARFDAAFWPPNAVTWMLENGKLTFAKIPEPLRTAANIATLVKKNAKEAAHIPAEYWTTDLLDQVIDKYGDALTHIDPANIPEHYLVGLATKRAYGGREFDDFFYAKKLPARLKTPRVILAFAQAGSVKIDDIPASMLTAAMVLSRMTAHPKEAADIPRTMLTPDFSVQVARANPSAVAHLPTTVYSEPLLYTWLAGLAGVLDGMKNAGNAGAATYHSYRHHSSNGPGIALMRRPSRSFRKTSGAARTLALAIDLDFVPPNKAALPPALLDRGVAGSLIAKNHADVNDLTDVLDDASIAEALKHNWQLLKNLPPEALTEPMAYSVMQRFAHAAGPPRYGRHQAYRSSNVTDDELKALLLAMPKKLWSKRVFEQAVGYIVPLKAVPAKWRDDAMIAAAVRRDPDNIRLLSDPAAWLNAHLANHGDDDWVRAIEANGVALLRKKYVNITSFPREPLSSGASFALVASSKINYRVYLFDKKNRLVLHFYTDKGKIMMSAAEVKKAEAYRADLLELARKSLGSFDMHALNDIGIYGDGRNNVRAEEKSSRTTVGDMSWSRNRHQDGTMYTAWHGDKPVLRLQTTTSRSGWGRRNSYIGDATTTDLPYCIAHSADIVTYLNRQIQTTPQWTAQALLSKLGIYFDRDKTAQTIAERSIGTVGSLTIYRNEKKIGLFTQAGMVASATILASGKISKVEVNRNVDGGISEVIAARLFDKVSAVLQRDKSATGLKLAEMLRRLNHRL